MTRNENDAYLMGALEALLFVSDEPASAARLAGLLGEQPSRVDQLLQALQQALGVARGVDVGHGVAGVDQRALGGDVLDVRRGLRGGHRLIPDDDAVHVLRELGLRIHEDHFLAAEVQVRAHDQKNDDQKNQ